MPRRTRIAIAAATAAALSVAAAPAPAPAPAHVPPAAEVAAAEASLPTVGSLQSILETRPGSASHARELLHEARLARGATPVFTPTGEEEQADRTETSGSVVVVVLYWLPTSSAKFIDDVTGDARADIVALDDDGHLTLLDGMSGQRLWTTSATGESVYAVGDITGDGVGEFELVRSDATSVYEQDGCDERACFSSRNDFVLDGTVSFIDGATGDVVHEAVDRWTWTSTWYDHAASELHDTVDGESLNGWVDTSSYSSTFVVGDVDGDGAADLNVYGLDYVSEDIRYETTSLGAYESGTIDVTRAEGHESIETLGGRVLWSSAPDRRVWIGELGDGLFLHTSHATKSGVETVCEGVHELIASCQTEEFPLDRVTTIVDVAADVTLADLTELDQRASLWPTGDVDGDGVTDLFFSSPLHDAAPLSAMVGVQLGVVSSRTADTLWVREPATGGSFDPRLLGTLAAPDGSAPRLLVREPRGQSESGSTRAAFAVVDAMNGSVLQEWAQPEHEEGVHESLRASPAGDHDGDGFEDVALYRRVERYSCEQRGNSYFCSTEAISEADDFHSSRTGALLASFDLLADEDEYRQTDAVGDLNGDGADDVLVINHGGADAAVSMPGGAPLWTLPHGADYRTADAWGDGAAEVLRAIGGRIELLDGATARVIWSVEL